MFMANEKIKNVSFVSHVESYPCLYDFTLSSYSRTDMKEKAWHEISKKTGDPVQLCKERWKNLRTVFLRHINQRKIKSEATGGFKRKYYLEDSMQFILPFLKGGRQQRGNLTTTSTMEQDLVNLNEDNPNDYLDVGLMEESELGQSETYNDTKIESSEAQNSDRTEPTTSTGRRADFNWYRTKNYYNNKEEGYDVDKCSIEYFEATEKNITRAGTECADQKFLLSLLPDMKQMNFKQKRKFKREILDVIDRILED